jgi:hypothetical protein
MSNQHERSRIVSAKLMQSWLEQGRGMGSEKSTRGWHTTENMDAPSHSAREKCPFEGRYRDYLSEGEEGLYYGAYRDKDVVEARENVLLSSSLTWRICKELGKPHPVYRGPDKVLMPFTTDLLISRSKSPKTVALSFKLREHLKTSREYLSLMVERAYWALHDVPFAVATDLELPKSVRESLRFLRPEQPRLQGTAAEQELRAKFYRAACKADWSKPLLVVVRDISSALHIDSDVGLQVLKRLLWDADIECDLTRSLDGTTRNAVIVS